jgi:hypothetical protein
LGSESIQAAIHLNRFTLISRSRADHALIGDALLLRFTLEEIDALGLSESVTFTRVSRSTS